jgi:hypothetical protein
VRLEGLSKLKKKKSNYLIGIRIRDLVAPLPTTLPRASYIGLRNSKVAKAKPGCRAIDNIE